MGPDLQNLLAAFVVAVTAVGLGRWLARQLRRAWDAAGRLPPSRPTSAVRPGTIAVSGEPPLPVALPAGPAEPPHVDRRRRRLTAGAARRGIVLATILGPCRAWSHDDSGE